ncbi:MAG: TonB-dependent receptor [Myxococcales bacterium]|nr:TonB-dependent receptor [Myxococcales bacterium]
MLVVLLTLAVREAGAAQRAEPEAVDPATEAAGDEDDGEVRTVVVTGTRTERSRSESPVATQVYDREQIEDSGGESLGEVLEETPGVQVSRGIGGVGIRMQGLDPSYTVVLIDGQRTTGRVNGVLDLSRFPAEDIEQIEIVRGPSSVLYGADALAGTINLVSRRAQQPHEAELHSAYGSFRTVDLTGRVGLSRRRYAGSLTGGWHRTDGWDADPSEPSTTGPRSNQLDLSTTHELGAYGPFTLGMRGSYLRRDSLLVDAPATGAVLDRHNRSEVLQATLRPRLEGAHDRLTMWASYNLFRDQFLQDQRGSTALDQRQDTHDHLGQLTAQYDHEIGAHVLSAGADTQLERLTTDRIDPPTVDRQRYAIFLQDEWRPTRAPTIVVLPGIRLDYDTYFGLYPTPRLATMLAPNERWTFRASYGRGFRAPSFREMFLLFANPSVGYTVRGNPQLRAETSWSASFSAEYRPWSWAWLAANVFDNRLQDTIVTDTTDPGDVDTVTLFEYVNVGEATTRGVETQAAITIRWRLTVDGSYTFVHTHDHTQGRPLPGRPRHSGTAGLRYHRPASGTTVRVRSSILGTRPFFVDTDDDGVDEQQRSPAFATIDVRLSQRLFHHVQLFAGVENLLDAGNATDTPLQPRTYYGGLDLRY